MWYLVIAQGARIVVVWISSSVGRKIFKTVALSAVGIYLAQRARAIEKREKRYDYIDTRAGEAAFDDQEFS